ncbi:dynactin subunit 2-like isoform X1 [Cygnus olor]|uniref:dynactin subunit 2-like isoform X1 n=1 Tax=Cygnus olor TaxID=8869 RepID=UPI001ADE17F0|nr:dynactin subunit 2-like isoform X1 [Cygnus olor]
MATLKFADLPSIAWNEPEVYETSDTLKGDQAEFEMEELTSTSVEHFIVNPNAAFENFKDKRLGTKGVDFSDSTSKTSTTGYKSGEHENSVLKESEAEEELMPVALARQVEGLKQQLVSSHLQKLLGPAAAIDFTDSEGTLAKRLLQQLEVVKCKKAVSGERPDKAPAPTGDMLTFELYWRPEQDQFSQAASIAELEKRLAQLEVMVRYEPDSQNPLLVGLKGTSLVETVQILQAGVNILDMAVLDQVEARLQSVLQKVIENTEHKAIVLDPETQSKIHQVHEMMQHWDPVASSLPDVVQRLLTLRDLHEEATWFMQALVYWETTQQEMVAALRSKALLLVEVQKMLKENLAIVQDNFSSLKAHIKQLQQ